MHSFHHSPNSSGASNGALPLFLCAARTGLRQGELLALQWEDVNLTGRFLEVRRNFTHGRLTTPKSGESRRVDLSRQLTETFEALQLDRQFETATHSQDTASPWVFCDRQGKPFHQNWVRLRFFRLLKGAGVRQVRFHDLAPYLCLPLTPKWREPGLREGADGP